MMTREQAIERLSMYPNLESMMLGCVSGKVSEWPMLRRELVKLLSEHKQTIAALAERVRELEDELVAFRRGVGA